MKTIVQNDNELIKMVQAGDTGKLGVLYERHKKDLFYYFYRMTNDQNKSEDMVQNTFIKVMKYNHQFSGEGKFTYWLFSIARNLWIDNIKKKDVFKNSYSEEVLQTKKSDTHRSDQMLIKEERKKMLHQALDMISPEKKEAIILSRFQELKYNEIARITDTTENNVKSRIRRGLQELKVIYEKLESN